MRFEVDISGSESALFNTLEEAWVYALDAREKLKKDIWQVLYGYTAFSLDEVHVPTVAVSDTKFTKAGTWAKRLKEAKCLSDSMLPHKPKSLGSTIKTRSSVKPSSN